MKTFVILSLTAVLSNAAPLRASSNPSTPADPHVEEFFAELEGASQFPLRGLRAPKAADSKSAKAVKKRDRTKGERALRELMPSSRFPLYGLPLPKDDSADAKKANVDLAAKFSELRSQAKRGAGRIGSRRAKE